jgi:GDPmannose 4,6-dehydratase
MLGKVTETPQTETTRFHPRSPYGASKAFAHHMTMNYREAHRLYACAGIMFNHESPLRGPEFVTRKITLGLARMRHAPAPIELGNLDARRDWGYAGDFVRAMWLMLQQDVPQDYLISTGESHSVREFVSTACRLSGIDLEWEGEGLKTMARDRRSGRPVVVVKPHLFRPAEVDFLTGDSSLARRELHWKPEVGFTRLVEMMLEADVRRVAAEHPSL